MPSEQLTLDQARHRGRRRLTDAQRAVRDHWLDEAQATLRRYLETHLVFHTDNIWAFGLAEPQDGDRRAFGAVVSRAVRDGWMELNTHDGYLLCLPSSGSNGSPKPTYRSLVFNAEGLR